MSLSLKEIAELTKTQLVGNPHQQISNVADLESATIQDASFLSNPRYEQAMHRSQAGVIFITSLPQNKLERNFLIAADPSQAFQTLINHFYAKEKSESGFVGIHPTAVIHPSVKLGAHVQIAPYAVIDQNVSIGPHTKIGAHVFIGPSSTLGEHCIIYSHVTIRENCQIGNRVILQPGAVIGSCGFGYITNKEGKHIKLEQVGNVTLEDDVEIGANTTIDRSRFKTTLISRGSKIDNQVQIAHGVRIGPDNILVSQVGIAGSTETGRHVVLGGQVGIAGHIKLGDGVMVAAASGVSKSLPNAGKYGGIPAVPIQEHNRNAVHLKNIENTIKKIEARLKALEA